MIVLFTVMESQHENFDANSCYYKNTQNTDSQKELRYNAFININWHL